jgi:[acyl-carrier-protein] S-malonyltransferase
MMRAEALFDSYLVSEAMTSFAFVFPGQGSQSVGMLDAWGDHPAVRQTLAEASARWARTWAR